MRLLECHRVLATTGSIYLHCDPTMSHYLKVLLDKIFGKSNFRNEIVWCYTGPSASKRQFHRKHDTILFYSKSDDWYFNGDAVRVPYKSIGIDRGDDIIFRKGSNENRIKELLEKGKIPNDWWADDYLTNISAWKSERTGYPTQKPLALLRRIIEASSREGDVVLDPFAGCATTCVAAEGLYRRWIGIDISEKAVELVKRRIKNDLGILSPNVIHRTDIPKRTDLGRIPRYNSPEIKKLLFGEQTGQCAGCHSRFEFRHLEVDHYIAQSVGGTDHIDNLQLLCSSCNRIKGNRGQEYLVTQLNLD